MTKRMLIDASHPEETRVVVADGTRIEELDFESSAKRQLRGNVYLARVTRVEPSLQAAFVEYGGNRHGFLAFSEIHPDYYQIPYEDRMALLEAEEADALADAQDDDEEAEKQAKKSDDDESVEPDDGEDADIDDEDDVAAETAAPAKKRRRSSNRRRYKIQEVIKRGQILLIQVVKEERGNKGAAMTTYLSLAGRYCVLMPNTPRGGGISRKIPNGSDRKRLKTIVADLKVPSGIGVIVRTAGAKRTKVEIKRDYDYLSRLWETIREKTLKSIAPSLIHEEGDLVKRSIRDLYDKEISQILVQGDDAYKDAKTFIKMLMPSHAKNVKAYKDSVPLFLRYNIESQLEDSLSSLVQLKSGGYLVIHPTEALVSIDVNSGRSTKERNVERTALKTNLEAVDEVARQMRLRDLAGLVVIDFIDMDEHKNNRAVERRMKDALSRDRARVQAGRISQFGLMEISRQRRRRSLLDASTISCPHCDGVGRQRSTESTALRALRAVAETGVRGKAARIRLSITPDVALYMINEKRQRLQEIEDTYNMIVVLHAENSLLKPDFSIDLLETRAGAIEDPMSEIEKEHRRERQDADREAAKAKKKKKTESKDSELDDNNPNEAAGHDDEDQPRRRRRRGRRGGRKRKSETTEGTDALASEADGESSELSGLDVIEPKTGDIAETTETKQKRAGRRKAPKGKASAANDGEILTEDTAVSDAPKARRSGRRKAPARKPLADDTPKASTPKTAKPSDDKTTETGKDAKKSAPRSTTRRAAPKRKTVDADKVKAAKPKPAPRKKPAAKKQAETTKIEASIPAKSTARRKAPPRAPIETAKEAVDQEAKKPTRRRAAPKRKTANNEADNETVDAPKAAKTKTTRKASTKKPKPDAAEKPKRTRKAPVKKATPKTETSETPKAKRTRKAPAKSTPPQSKDSNALSDQQPAPKPSTRQSVQAEAPPSISTDLPINHKDAEPTKKGKKRSWLKRLTGGDKD